MISDAEIVDPEGRLIAFFQVVDRDIGALVDYEIIPAVIGTEERLRLQVTGSAGGSVGIVQREDRSFFMLRLREVGNIQECAVILLCDILASGSGFFT